MVRGLLGLASQLPFLALQKVLLFRQSFDGVLALLQGESTRGVTTRGMGPPLGPETPEGSRPPDQRKTPGGLTACGLFGLWSDKALGLNPGCATSWLGDWNRDRLLVDAQEIFFNA